MGSGNVYNMADTMDIDDPFIKEAQGKLMVLGWMTLLIQFITGKVHIFKLHGNSNTIEPYMAFKHKVTDTLRPVLNKLGTQYSPVHSK